MINKYLEKKVKIISKDNNMPSLEQAIDLEYYLLESKLDKNHPSFSENIPETVYGIEVVMFLAGNNVEQKIIKHLSHCKQKTLSILHKLINNTVTPSSVLLVLDDIIGT